MSRAPDVPDTPAAVNRELLELRRQFDEMARLHYHAANDAANKKNALKKAESRAFLKAEGTIPDRHAKAVEATEKERDAYEVAAAVLRQINSDRARLKDEMNMLVEVSRNMRAEQRFVQYGGGA